MRLADLLASALDRLRGHGAEYHPPYVGFDHDLDVPPGLLDERTGEIDLSLLHDGELDLGPVDPAFVSPVDLLHDLGAQWSPDLDAYASGTIPVSAIRCVLCKVAPCACYPCPADRRPGVVCGWTRQHGRKCIACGAK